MMDDQQNNLDFTINRSNLYREESFTDLQVGTVKRLKPVRVLSSEPSARNPQS